MLLKKTCLGRETKCFLDKKDCETCLQKMNTFSNGNRGKGIPRGSGLNKSINMGLYQTWEMKNY